MPVLSLTIADSSCPLAQLLVAHLVGEIPLPAGADPTPACSRTSNGHSAASNPCW
jgi:hypothetical protein